MECVNARIPYTKWRLHAFRQLLATSRPLTAQAASRGISTARQNESNESSSETEEDNSGPKPIPPSQRLPQSPLFRHPRHREKTRKRRATTEEEANLRKNPWAVMLASPPRMCTITAARLPSDLLGTWGLVRQPDEEKLYMMPVGLLRDSSHGKKTQIPDSSPEATIADPLGSANTQVASPEEDSPLQPVVPDSQVNSAGRELLLRITELLPLLRCITPPLVRNRGTGRSKRNAMSRLIPFRWKQPTGPITAHVEKQISWSEDMPDVVLYGMRSRVIEKLGAVLEKYKRVGTPNGVWRALDLPVYSDVALEEVLGSLDSFERMEGGAVLLLGSELSVAAGDVSNSKVALESVALTQTGSKVPVFDLSVLFSESDLEKLRESHGQLQHKALFFRPEDQIGIEAMVALWKLKRLLAAGDIST
ncbi:uncharacterized protein N7515_008626 [Penicillium bovifimosum]|uniref:Uncharacterized protein n=1 Tax=Penicillium bovifimosum TaxID=126998 RepID=A0A9W9GND4_9EURO|nr:uncharacterized protein N7515_008626 [Penicillium bovifimosum]KAJ5124801.1 hypothetical protein N7515_008626 [Penicillium bovifimosum]